MRLGQIQRRFDWKTMRFCFRNSRARITVGPSIPFISSPPPPHPTPPALRIMPFTVLCVPPPGHSRPNPGERAAPLPLYLALLRTSNRIPHHLLCDTRYQEKCRQPRPTSQTMNAPQLLFSRSYHSHLYTFTCVFCVSSY